MPTCKGSYPLSANEVRAVDTLASVAPLDPLFADAYYRRLGADMLSSLM